MVERPFADAPENSVEVRLTDQEGIVLWPDRTDDPSIPITYEDLRGVSHVTHLRSRGQLDWNPGLIVVHEDGQIAMDFQAMGALYRQWVEMDFANELAQAR